MKIIDNTAYLLEISTLTEESISFFLLSCKDSQPHLYESCEDRHAFYGKGGVKSLLVS